MISASEDVGTLLVNVAEIVHCGHVRHSLTVSDTSPGVSLHVLAVLDGVFLHLFHVGLLGSAVAATDAFIEASLQHVTLLERSEKWLLFLCRLLFWEGDVGAIGCEARVEAASLTDSVGPRLISVEDP